MIAREVEKRGLLDDYPEVDGVIPLVHGHGCGMDSKGEGYEVLKRTQWGYAANPNMGAVLMVGLGCETFQIARWKQAYNIAESDTFRSLTIQDTGGTQKAMEAGLAAVRDMLPGRQRGAARNRAGVRTDAGAAMRRQRRLFRHHRQSGAGRGGGSAGGPWRHRHPVGDAGDLWRRASAHPPRQRPTSARS